MAQEKTIYLMILIRDQINRVIHNKSRADVPGWVLVVLMTTALVTGIWSIAAPNRKPLIGGGSILLLEKTTEVSKFIDISTPARKKVVAIAVDEDNKN